MNHKHLTTQEAAEYLRMHKMTVYRLIKTKKIPASKPFGRWRIALKDLEKLMETNDVQW
jgi:excisionase family DNA binding protein